ncbi:MAG: carbohydrate kinase [Chloroflexi bacterium]|nr:carbohydrate kinase [Chloroflexota bacterium]
MSSQPTYDILMFGHFAKDRNVVDGHGEIASGGAVYYGSVVVRRIGLRVGIVTRLRADDFARLDELKQEGIDVFATSAPETSGIENTYKSSDMERRVCKLLGFAGAMQRADIPNATARIYAVVPIIAGEFDLAYLNALAARGPVALDVQGFVRMSEGRDLVSRPWKEMADGLKHVTYLKVDRAEAELLTGETDLARAARKLAAYGPREIVLTQSSGVTVFADGKIFTAPFTPRSLAGRTGRGDTCFMSYLSWRLSATPDDACRFAAAVTTLKQEKPGPWRGALADVEVVIAT